MSKDFQGTEVKVTTGQCGLCVHFAEHHPEEQEEVLQIRRTHKAPADKVEECGHPAHASLHLKVNATSGCDGFKAVKH